MILYFFKYLLSKIKSHTRCSQSAWKMKTEQILFWFWKICLSSQQHFQLTELSSQQNCQLRSSTASWVSQVRNRFGFVKTRLVKTQKVNSRFTYHDLRFWRNLTLMLIVTGKFWGYFASENWVAQRINEPISRLHSLCFIRNTVNEGLVSYFQKFIVVA